MTAATAQTSSLLSAYSRIPLDFERGEGAYLFTREGQAYLDFASGIAVNCLGHSHPRLMEALCSQAARLWHVSNLYETRLGETFAANLCSRTFADKVFFTNSGAESLEGAIKLARRYQNRIGKTERYRIITITDAFHGRTLATMAATGSAKVLDGFGPKIDAFDQVSRHNMNALRNAITQETAAILLEPVQGEGGIIPFSSDFLADVRTCADEFGLLLIYDEVQCGFGRTGDLFAYQDSGVAPDIMAVAKGIGGGFPMGAILANEKASIGFTPGSHGSTYGGGPLAMAVGQAVLDELTRDGFMEKVKSTGLLLQKRLQEVQKDFPEVLALLRGRGLMLGMKTGSKFVNLDLVEALRNEKVLTVAAGDNTVRLLPPLNINQTHIEEFESCLRRACSALEEKNRKDKEPEK